MKAVSFWLSEYYNAILVGDTTAFKGYEWTRNMHLSG